MATLLELLEVATSFGDLLVKRSEVLAELRLALRKLLVLLSCFCVSLHCIYARVAGVVETTSQCTLLVGSVTVRCDGTDTVGTSVLRCSLQIGAHDCLAEDLLESLRESVFVLELRKHVDYIAGVGEVGYLGIESIERHECHSAALLSL